MSDHDLHAHAAPPEGREAERARGFGFASAVRLAPDGAAVWITDRDAAAPRQAGPRHQRRRLAAHALPPPGRGRRALGPRMDLDARGAVWAGRALLPALAARGFGRVVNCGAQAGRFGRLVAGPRSAAEGTIAMLTRQLAQRFGPFATGHGPQRPQEHRA